MSKRLHRVGIGFLVASALMGCVATHAPLKADSEYPNAWGEVLPLGRECKAVEGRYRNQGEIVDVNGVSQAALLTTLLDIRSDARVVSLKVHTRRVDQSGDAFITLAVVPDDNLANTHELETCFCIKQTLACPRIGETYWSLPNFGFGGQQSNLYFSLSKDQSLVGKLQNYHAEALLGLPSFGMKEPWIRFIRADK